MRLKSKTGPNDCAGPIVNLGTRRADRSVSGILLIPLGAGLKLLPPGLRIFESGGIFLVRRGSGPK